MGYICSAPSWIPQNSRLIGSECKNEECPYCKGLNTSCKIRLINDTN